MSSIHTQEIEVEVEADYARISLLTDKASFKSLSPQLQWAITTAQSYGTLLGMCVTVPMTIECYAGEEPVYYPNDKAYPGKL